MSSDNKLPSDYSTVTPSLMFKDASKAINFYKDLFGAVERYRLEYNNKIVHAEIKIGTSIIMVADEMPGMEIKYREGELPITLYIYVDDVDKTFAKAVKLGSRINYKVETQFYGDRIGAITDPFGYNWTIATKVKDVSMDEIKKKLPEFVEKMGKQKSDKDDYKQKYLKYKQKYLELKNKIPDDYKSIIY